MVTGPPRDVSDNTIVHVQEEQDNLFIEKRIAAYPKPNVTCYTSRPNGSHTVLATERYAFTEDTHAYRLQIILLWTTPNSVNYTCYLTNAIGSTSIVFEVVTNMTEADTNTTSEVEQFIPGDDTVTKDMEPEESKMTGERGVMETGQTFIR